MYSGWPVTSDTFASWTVMPLRPPTFSLRALPDCCSCGLPCAKLRSSEFVSFCRLPVPCATPTSTPCERAPPPFALGICALRRVWDRAATAFYRTPLRAITYTHREGLRLHLHTSPPGCPVDL